MSWGTTRPEHDSLSAIGTGTSFSAFTSFYNTSNKAFQDLKTIGSGTSFSAFDYSSFAVITDSNIPVAPDDSCGIDDDLIVGIAIQQSDGTGVGEDLLLSAVVFVSDESDIDDLSLIGAVVFCDEDTGLVEGLDASDQSL